MLINHFNPWLTSGLDPFGGEVGFLYQSFAIVSLHPRFIISVPTDWFKGKLFSFAVLPSKTGGFREFVPANSGGKTQRYHPSTSSAVPLDSTFNFFCLKQWSWSSLKTGLQQRGSARLGSFFFFVDLTCSLFLAARRCWQLKANANKRPSWGVALDTPDLKSDAHMEIQYIALTQ